MGFIDPADAAAVMNDAIVVLKRVARDDGFAKGEVHRSNFARPATSLGRTDITLLSN